MSSGTTTTPAPAAARARSRASFRSTLAMFVIGLLFVGAVLAYSVLYFGFVEGSEFAPDNFSRRRFSFFEIPVIGLQITPLQRKDITNDLESYLTNSKFVTAPKIRDDQRRWDLVMAERGAVPEARRIISQGEARILCEYLDAKDSQNELVWLTWSKQHPKLAGILWPAVAKVALQELYLFVPDLLVCARNASDPAQLPAEINRILVEKYIAFGIAQQQLGRHDAAVELFTEAIALAPTRSDVLVHRAASLASLGRHDKAAADSAAARQLSPKPEAEAQSSNGS